MLSTQINILIGHKTFKSNSRNKNQFINNYFLSKKNVIKEEGSKQFMEEKCSK